MFSKEKKKCNEELYGESKQTEYMGWGGWDQGGQVCYPECEPPS